MFGTPGTPIVTEEWQALPLFALIHRHVRRRAARDRARDRD